MEDLPKIDLKLEIRRNADNVIATDVWKDWEYNTYWWEEGNASCDCNRELFFCRALELPAPEECVCSEKRYSIRLTDNNTGEVLYNEFEE